MAAVSSLHRCFSPPVNKKGLKSPNPFPKTITFLLGSVSSGVNQWRRRPFLCCCNNFSQPEEEKKLVCMEEGDELGTKRRQVMIQMGFAAFSFPPIVFVSNAMAEIDIPQDFRPYTDDMNKFKIMIPQDWQVGMGEPNGFKSVTAFYPEKTSSSNVSVVITGIGPDFTRMESFGKVDEFADTLVSGLDRSWQRPPGVAAKLIDCKSANGFYYIEYTLQSPGESKKHLFTAIGMAFNGWYNRLYTVTGQFVEEEAQTYGPQIEKTVASFRFI
ncbi:hypothetical protein SLE2022_175000 [Rubroshorea leprosula]